MEENLPRIRDIGLKIERKRNPAQSRMLLIPRFDEENPEFNTDIHAMDDGHVEIEGPRLVNFSMKRSNHNIWGISIEVPPD